ncbi:helix-turn-helix domain-containing protein [Anaerostipes caccae]|uniref:helix-turn-helix domain-containing protein n=1 Tax=Anaerostipes caccae TaxID=105841 RepID=UPI0026711ED8|nr:helix-turn-helix domain-containing protein [Anaerostipes caccae]
MDDQQNTLTYEIIKAAVAGEKWATERILKHYDSYMDELATVKARQPDGSVRTYVDEDLKQEIALKLLEEIPNFPLKKAERVAKEETDGI